MPSTTHRSEAPGIPIVVAAGLVAALVAVLLGALTTDATLESAFDRTSILPLFVFESVEYVPFAVAALGLVVGERRGESTGKLAAIPAVITPVVWILIAWAVGWLSPRVDPIDLWTTLALVGVLPALAYMGARRAYEQLPEDPTRDDLPAIVEPIAGLAVAGVVLVVVLRVVLTEWYDTVATVEGAVAMLLQAGVVPLVVPTAIAVTTAWLLAANPSGVETLKVGFVAAVGIFLGFLVLSTASDALLSTSGAFVPYGTPFDLTTSSSLFVLAVTAVHRLVPVLALPAALRRVGAAERPD